MISFVDGYGRNSAGQLSQVQNSPRNSGIQNNIVEFDLSYNFSIPGNTHRVSLLVVLPETLPDRQKIHEIKCSRKPLRIFKKDGNRYAEFVFMNPERRIDIEISVTAELFRYDFITASRNNDKNPVQEADLIEYLKEESCIEKDDEKIKETAKSIEGKNDLEIVQGIYDYVLDNMEYVLHGKQAFGAVKALRLKKGDCSEYADLFVALCRSRNIPARVVTGYTVKSDTKTSKHNWVEVYLQKYGWVPFDPSSGDRANGFFRDLGFRRMEPVYIYFSYTRNDAILRNFHFCSYSYWGDRVRLNDSIEFNRPAFSSKKR
jgi:transglutaminase-like putative cysteine protease